MNTNDLQDLLALLDDSLELTEKGAKILDAHTLRKNVHRLAWVSALETGTRQTIARYLCRQAALAYGVIPASINDLYLARGRGEVPVDFTVPAINLRSLSFDAAQAVFRTAKAVEAGAFIFEIARSEIGYTDQRPGEYATNILAAAIAEDYSGPVFIQGDHFQISAKRFADDPDAEVRAVRDLIQEAIQAGFFNIDIDTSTLVDLSKTTIPEQQSLNANISAELTEYIRSIEPQGITVSVGGEIGEVGGHNSTAQELRAYMDGYSDALTRLAPQVAGLSKVSIQTGTSHGGVVLPDGSIKQVSVDFNTLQRLSRLARQGYGLAGAVQHGASTLPEEAFGKFVEAEACEVHLATNFQNMLFERLPDDLREDMYAYLDEKHAGSRKPGMTDEQFYYKTRKYAIGPFKNKLWNHAPEKKEEIALAWQEQFSKLFKLLGIGDTRKYVQQTIQPVPIQPEKKEYLGEQALEGKGDVSDLAD
jgi:fructose/tagatose bisphosphate aldolase